VSTKAVPPVICQRRCKMDIGHATALKWLDKALWIGAHQLARPSMSHVSISSSLPRYRVRGALLVALSAIVIAFIYSIKPVDGWRDTGVANLSPWGRRLVCSFY
jgi:hypothetical protein